MAIPRRDMWHSRLVSVLKVLLPLIALVLLSTLFLFSRKINPEDAIPYATVDVEDRLRDPKMTDAGFAGMTADGSSLTIAASEAKPTAEGGALKLVQGLLQTPDGAKTELASAAVALDSAQKMIELSDGAELRAASGYVVQAQGFGVSTADTRVESRGAISAIGPGGQLSADHMLLSQQGADGPYLLVFNGKVRLLYQPKR
jgi:lipopolysaccharide export system protein LptC